MLGVCPYRTTITKPGGAPARTHQLQTHDRIRRHRSGYQPSHLSRTPPQKATRREFGLRTARTNSKVKKKRRTGFRRAERSRQSSLHGGIIGATPVSAKKHVPQAREQNQVREIFFHVLPETYIPREEQGATPSSRRSRTLLVGERLGFGMIVAVKLEAGHQTKSASNDRGPNRRTPFFTPRWSPLVGSVVQNGLEDLGDFWERYEGDEGEEQKEARRDDSPISNLGQLVLTITKKRKQQKKKK